MDQTTRSIPFESHKHSRFRARSSSLGTPLGKSAQRNLKACTRVNGHQQTGAHVQVWMDWGICRLGGEGGGVRCRGLPVVRLDAANRCIRRLVTCSRVTASQDESRRWVKRQKRMGGCGLITRKLQHCSRARQSSAWRPSSALVQGGGVRACAVASLQMVRGPKLHTNFFW